MNTTKTHVNASISSGRISVPYNETLLDCYWPFVRVIKAKCKCHTVYSLRLRPYNRGGL